MAKAIDILIDQDFISAYDEDDEKTTWKLRTLTGLEFLECTSQGFLDHKTIIEYGLSGWDNFNDSDGKAIEYSKEMIPLIPADILADISFKIQEISSMTDNERKN